MLAYPEVYVDTNNIIYAILLLSWAFATIWTQIEDREDHLLITYGPWRFFLCGMGKEKIPYDIITDFEITQTCSYGFGIPNCSTIKLFNTCSCCCGRNHTGGGNPSFCGQKTIRITIKERPQGQDAIDDNDCCLERCCLASFCGNRGKYIGKGCCCQPLCNPCNANCCMMNTIFVSTNDPQGLFRLLNEKTGRNNDGSGQVTIAI